MSSLDELYQSLPMAQIAQSVGANEADVQQATAAILPALVGGLQANAEDPAGAASIEQALQSHDGSLLDGGVDVSQIDQADGAKIASHIFGGNEDEVVARLGGVGGSGLNSPLVKRLLPILAPIVMAYIAKQVFGGTTTREQQSSGGGMLGSVLGSILAGGAGGGLGSVLGSVLGSGQTETQAGRPSVDPQPQAPSQDAPAAATSSGNATIDSMIESAISGGSAGTDSSTDTGSQQAQSGQGGGLGDLLGGILGGVLGGGRR